MTQEVSQELKEKLGLDTVTSEAGTMKQGTPAPFRLSMEDVMQKNSIEAVEFDAETMDKMAKDASEYAIGFNEMRIMEQAKNQGYDIESLENMKNLKYATKEEFEEVVAKGGLQVNQVRKVNEETGESTVVLQGQTISEEETQAAQNGVIEEDDIQHDDTILPSQPVNMKKTSIVSVKRSSLLGVANNKLERIKNRRRKGRFTTGLLYNSNLMVQCYDLDKPLLLEELLNGFMYLTATMFHSKKMMQKLYEHTSILCADGATIDTAEKFFDVVALDDFEEYLIYMLVASNDNGILKGIDMSCTNETCNHKFVSDIDLCEGLEGMITPDRRAIYESYDKNAKLQTLLDKAQITDIDVVTSYDEIADEYTVVTTTSPTISKYFSIKEALMGYIHESLMSDEDVAFKVQASVKDFHKRGLDERLRILATLERDKYVEISDTINIMAYIDTIHIIPGDTYRAYQNNTHPKYKVMSDFKDGENDVIIVKPTPDDINNLYEVFSQLDLNALDIVRQSISNITTKLKRGVFKLTKTCPKCGHKIEQDFSAISLFLVFLNLKEVMMNGKR